MAGRTGLEPATSGSTVRSSNQLSYLPGRRKRPYNSKASPEPQALFSERRIFGRSGDSAAWFFGGWASSFLGGLSPASPTVGLLITLDQPPSRGGSAADRRWISRRSKKGRPPGHPRESRKRGHAHAPSTPGERPQRLTEGNMEGTKVDGGQSQRAQRTQRGARAWPAQDWMDDEEKPQIAQIEADLGVGCRRQDCQRGRPWRARRWRGDNHNGHKGRKGGRGLARTLACCGG